MKTQSKPYTEVFAYMRSKHPLTRPNVGYTEQLEIYSQSGCNVTPDNAAYKEWKAKTHRALDSCPTAYNGCAEGNNNMSLIIDGIWLGE